MSGINGENNWNAKPPGRAPVSYGLYIDGARYHCIAKLLRHDPGFASYPDLRKLTDLLCRAAEAAFGASGRAHFGEKHYFQGAPMIGENNSEIGRHITNFNNIAANAGLTVHRLPASASGQEKGIDIKLALHAQRAGLEGSFEGVVLFAGDADFVPLIHELQRIGIRVAVVTCKRGFTDSHGQRQRIGDSTHLIAAADAIIDLNALFDTTTPAGQEHRELVFPAAPRETPEVGPDEGTQQTATPITSSLASMPQHRQWHTGIVERDPHRMRGFSFIVPEGPEYSQLFFHVSKVIQYGPSGNIRQGDRVRYTVGRNNHGPQAESICVITEHPRDAWPAAQAS